MENWKEALLNFPSSAALLSNGPDKRKREWFFLWFLSFIRICKNDTHARCPITVGPKSNLGRYALIEGLQLPSSAEEGTADAPASAGVVLVKKLNSARFLAGQVQRIKDRSVLKVQNSKFPSCAGALYG
jgi:hypothetical protein